MLNFFARTAKLGLSNFFRNSWLSFVTVFIVFLALFSIFVLGSVNMVGTEAIAAVKNKVDVDVFFELSSEESNVLATQQYLLSMPEVRDVTYISPDAALEDFEEDHIDDPIIQASLSEIDSNPLPATLVVKAYSLEQYPEILGQLEGSQFNEFVASQNFIKHQSVIQTLSNVTKNVSYFGVGISGMFILVGILVVFNSIRITIYTHREEIGIMKLVGASNAFIRMPIVFESVLYATIATALVFGVGYPMVVFASPSIDAFFGDFNFSFMEIWTGNLIALFGLIYGIGLAMSIVSSLVAVRRYLKV